MDQPLDVQPRSSDAKPSGVDDFRISAPAEVLALLKQLADGQVRLNLAGSRGDVYTTTLWAIDPARGTISFAGDADDGPLQALVESEDAVVVAYLDSVKLQFDATGLVIVHGGRDADEGALLDIAGALLYVEASLDDQVERATLVVQAEHTGRDDDRGQAGRSAQTYRRDPAPGR